MSLWSRLRGMRLNYRPLRKSTPLRSLVQADSSVGFSIERIFNNMIENEQAGRAYNPTAKYLKVGGLIAKMSSRPVSTPSIALVLTIQWE